MSENILGKDLNRSSYIYTLSGLIIVTLSLALFAKDAFSWLETTRDRSVLWFCEVFWLYSGWLLGILRREKLERDIDAEMNDLSSSDPTPLQQPSLGTRVLDSS